MGRVGCIQLRSSSIGIGNYGCIIGGFYTTFNFQAVDAGLGHFIHTYVCDGNPVIPTFQGEPERVNIPQKLEDFAEELWNNLDENNKISLFVRYTDLETGKVIDILRTRYKHDLYDYFKRYPREERAKVHYFVSDMYQTYADIAKTWFPNATYIIDKYHWVRQVSFAFERVRKDVQKKFSKSHRIYFKHSRMLLLKRWKELTDEQKQQVNVMLYASAELSTAYFLKEQLYKIIHEVPAEKFEESLRSWIEDAHGSDIEPFVKCALTYRHWFSPIVQSLQHKYTNGFTEGCNNKIKVLKRISYGLQNFIRFRSRILYLFH